MSWTHDRSIRSNGLVLFVVLVLGIVAAGGYYFYFWPHREPPDRENNQPQSGNSVIQPAFRNEPLSVTFYYPLAGMLASASAPAKRQPDTQAQAAEALGVVLTDPRAAQADVIRDVKLVSFFLDARGTAYVNLSLSQSQSIRASAWDEELAIYAMVNTLMQNFDDVKQVAFLLDGREAPTLAGHMDLARIYTKRTDLVKQ